MDTQPEPAESSSGQPLPSGSKPADPSATIADERSTQRDAPLSIERGAAVGRYLVVDKLGAGAMGVVFRAYDPDLDRSVALKLVATDEMGPTVADQERARLMREAQAIARLSHPNVITVYDVGTVGQSVYVAMEFVDGVTLRQWNKNEHALGEVLDVFVQAGRGLSAAHHAGLVHRDFKPDNVMIDLSDSAARRVRVLDFGLARSTDEGPRSTDVEDLRSQPSDRNHSLDRSMTAAGAVMGTPAYMSAEQHLGETATAASDQFSFCVALFEALYGHRPFAGRSLATLATAVLAGEVTYPDDAPSVPSHVQAVLDRGLATDPEERFESMDALLRLLSRRPRRRTVGWAVGAMGGAALAGVVTWNIRPTEDEARAVSLCSGGPDKLDQVWNDAARQRMAREFEATGRAYATEVWTATASLLDERASAWVAGYTEACEATRFLGEQSEELLDRRMSCYDHQLKRTAALLEALHEPDDDALRSAIDAAMALPDVGRCADTAALMKTVVEIPPQHADRVAALQERLDNVRAEISLGHFARARQSLGTTVDDARSVEHPPTLATALTLHAELLAATGDPRGAATANEDAFVEAVAAGDDRMAAELARQLAFDWGSPLSAPAAGRRWLAVGRAELRRLGGDADIEAGLYTSEGAIEVAAGDYVAALQAHARARTHWEGTAPASAALARTLNDIGTVYVQQGDAEAATKLHAEAVRLKEALYGAHHPETAAALRELGTALSHAEKFDEAASNLQRAMEIEKGARGEDSTRVATLLDDLGRIARSRGELDEAIGLHRKALKVWEAALGDPHPDLGVSILNVGYTLSAAGRFAEALEQFERALVMFQATVGPEHAYVVYASNSAASALIDLERYEAALVHVERVLAMKDVQADPTLIAETKFMGTHALWAEGNPAPAERRRARQLASEARSIYAAGAERWKPWVERVDTWLAEH